MKKICSFIFLIIFLQKSQAQFSVDPAQPLPVCNASGGQANVSALPDGSGGYFVFWLDARADGITKRLYGQHLTGEGVPLWTPNGKLIGGNGNKSLMAFRSILFDGGILVCWINTNASGYGDSLLVKKIDTSGNDVWSQPTLFADNTGQIGMVSSGFNAFVNDSGAWITYCSIFIGGSSAILFNRIDFSGNLRWALNSNANTLSGYDYRSSSDGQNGLYALSKGNGIGSMMYVQHFDLQGMASWPQSVEFTGGGNVNGFSGNLILMHDDESNYYCVWDANNGKIMASKVNTDGTIAWSTNPKILADVASSSQNNCHAIFSENKIYACWTDTRIAGQTSVFATAIDTSSSDLWTAGGVFVGVQNAAYSRAKMALSDSGSVVSVFISATLDSLLIQRIHSDGSLTWSGNGKALSSQGANGPYYDDHVEMDDAGGCNAVFWGSSADNNIYGAKICSNGNLINVPGLTNDQSALKVYPNPCAQTITVGLSEPSGEASEKISIVNLLGELVLTVHFSEHSNPVQEKIEVSQLPAGIYTVEINSATHPRHAVFVKE